MYLIFGERIFLAVFFGIRFGNIKPLQYLSEHSLVIAVSEIQLQILIKRHSGFCSTFFPDTVDHVVNCIFSIFRKNYPVFDGTGVFNERQLKRFFRALNEKISVCVIVIIIELNFSGKIKSSGRCYRIITHVCFTAQFKEHLNKIEIRLLQRYCFAVKIILMVKIALELITVDILKRVRFVRIGYRL